MTLIQVSHCASCHSIACPPQPNCQVCGQRDQSELVALPSEGTLYTFTVIHAAPPGVPTPYAIGCADFSEECRLFGRITEVDHLRVGMLVQLVFHEGQPTFQPIVNHGAKI